MNENSSQYSANDIAVVGMALRVPGASNVNQFWDNLRNGVESIRDLSEEELLSAGEIRSRIHNPNYVRRTADLAEMELFDPEFFGLSPKDAAVMDPQHRQFLECAWEAMEDAGRVPRPDDGPVGVFAGCGMGSYFYWNVCSHRQLVDQTGMFLLRHTGNDKDFLATRASFSFDLRGPSINVQTACSTSLVAVHMACQSLLAGECEAALAGGVTIELPHRRGYIFQENEILSADGHCRAFDHRAGGTVFGSGVGVVVLRRLSDALADGDIIHGIIKGSAVNNDGASKATYLAPSVTGQAEAILEAQGLAGVSADTIQYVECHGTGTYLGDPIEIEALTQAFRQSTTKTGFCRVGSVKSNIGHLDTAAGVIGLIKAVLSIKHGEMPPTLGFDEPNPTIDFKSSPFIVNDTLTRWPSVDGPRRAAVNSLGVGGTNAHLVVEEAPKILARADDGKLAQPEIFLFSTRQRKSLDRAVVQLSDALVNRPELSLQDAAYTLYAGRKHFEHRRVVAAADREEAIALLRAPESKRIYTHNAMEVPGAPVFVFPGGGAQHVGMARKLYDQDAEFRATVDEALAGLDAEAHTEIRRAWLDQDVDGAEAAVSFLRPSVQLPAILIIEVAVARYWMRHGVKPSACIGHSMGENAAACVAGVLTLRDAVRLVRLRGELFETVEPGGMLSVPLSAAALRDILPAHLDLASVNAPELCVVSGRNDDLEAFAKELATKEIDAVRVPINIAAHSHMLEAILPRFEAYLRSVRLNKPSIPIVSNLTGDWLSDEDAQDPRYWVRHLRSTVEFGRGVALLAQDPNRVFIEVGPGRALSSLVKLQAGVISNQVINSLPHADDGTDDRVHLLAALGRAWAIGLDFPLERLWQETGARRVPLPTYPFQHQRYFLEPAISPQAQPEEETPLKRQDIADWGYRPTWRKALPDYLLGAEKNSTSFLVFVDGSSFSASLVDHLRTMGHQVRTVRVGDTFAKLSPDEYVVCPEDGPAGYDALLAGLSADGPIPSNVVHMWLLTQEHRAGSSSFNRNMEQGFYSLLFLAQSLGKTGAPTDLQITVAVDGMQQVHQEPVLYPEKATVLGPAMTIPKEMAGVDVRVIDLQLPTAAPRRSGRFSKAPMVAVAAIEQLTALFLEELFGKRGSEVLAYRGGFRWKRDYAPLPLVETDDRDSGFRSKGVYLITGGLGDLALALAERLASKFDARIILTGRSELPPRTAWPAYIRSHSREDRRRRAVEKLLAMEAGGHEVLYLKGDVANLESMTGVVESARAAFGEIHGVVHAAGLVDDNLIAFKTMDQVENVLSPKLHGTAVLDQVFRDISLDLFVLFSSTSTDTAPAGQADYVAANAYLNAYAVMQGARTDRRTTAIHWGVWNEVGLAARATLAPVSRAETTIGPAIGQFFQRWVEDEKGLQWLEAEIGPGTDWVLDEHRMVTGQPVMPGTGYIEIAAQVVRESGLSPTFSLENLVFLRPLAVADGATISLRARLAFEEAGHRLEICAGSPAAGFDIFAEASLHMLSSDAPRYLDLTGAVDAARERQLPTGTEALRSVQDGRVSFGPRWQVLRSTAFGVQEAVAELSLPQLALGDQDAGTLVHPALLDIATGFALQLAPGYVESQALWVPISYGRASLLSPMLPADIRSHVRLRTGGDLEHGYVTFDVTITDQAGLVVMDIEGFTMKRLDHASLSVGADAIVPRRDVGRATGGMSSSPAMLRLAAQVRQGILPDEGFEAMLRTLATGEVQPVISSMDLEALRKPVAQATEGAGASEGFDRPDLDSDYVAPRNDVERTLAGFWSELLGIEEVGVNDSFFDLGGHSLIAVRLFRMVKQAFSIDLPISALFEYPTIAQCAALLGGQGVSEATTEGDDAVATPSNGIHLVPMSVGANPASTPFFICSGMFGNVLNLRQLALHLGKDRAVYGLQARGLYGDQEPHDSFEEAARDYLAEIRTVQPHGPYLLGGFSGGGLIAYEIAQQLRSAGEQVSMLVMLDTPLPTQPPLSVFDRVNMKFQDLQRSGPSFVSDWLKTRKTWRAGQLGREEALLAETSAAQFHNLKVEAAFRRALPRYEVRRYDGKVVLFRPKLEILYRLSGGRRLQGGRNVALDDNGWTPFVADLTVHEVPGDHDSMVLEPYVRVLVSRLRKEIDEIDANLVARRIAAE